MDLKFDELKEDAPHVEPAHGVSFDALVDDEEKYGGITGSLKTAALGAADSATLGLSNLALTKTGLVSPETIKGLQETNPVSHFAGEVAGVFAPTGAAGLVGKAGAGVYKGAQALTGVGKLGQIGAHALGSAVEGAIYAGTQNTINELALGDPDLNAEKVMANFGHGALAGGVLGGLLKTASIGAPPALKAAKEASVALRDLVIGSGVDGSAGLVGKVAPNSKLAEALGQRMTSLNPEQQVELLNSTTKELNALNNNTQTAVKNLNESIRPQEVDALINTANPQRVMGAAQEIRSGLVDAVNVMEANPALFSSNASAKIKQHIEQLDNKLYSWAKKPMFEEVGSEVFDDLKKIKQSLGNWGHGITQDVTKADTKKALTELTSFISGKLKDPEIFGDVGARYAAHDDILHEMYQFIGPNGKPTPKLLPLMTNVGSKTKPQFEFDSSKIQRMFKSAEHTNGQAKIKNLNDYFDILNQLPEHLESTHANVPNSISFQGDELLNAIKSAKDSTNKAAKTYADAIQNNKTAFGLRDVAAGAIALHHPILGAAAEALNIINHPFGYMSSLAEIERMVGKIDRQVSKAAKAVFNPSLKAIGRTTGILSSEFTKEEVENHKKLRDDLAQLNNNPALMVERFGKATAQLDGVAPQMAGGLQDSMIRANQFLQSKLPPTVSENPFDPTPEPSRSEIATFNRYRQIVEDPMLALHQVRNGTIGPETVDTIKTVYPRLYDQMKGSLLDVMTDKLAKGEVVPYQLKQSISFFFQMPLDRSLQAMSIMANQAAMIANQIQQQPQGQGINKAGAQKMTLAERSSPQRPSET